MAVVRLGDIKTFNRDQPLPKVFRLSGETTSYGRRPCSMFIDDIGNNLVHVS